LSIAVDNVVKRFGNFAALNGVSLQAEPGEFLALLGPSGSGKTTLLRIMAGLEFPDSGAVTFEGRDVTGLGVRDRRIGFVFQHYALFPHMNVADNVAFGLTVKRRSERPKRAEIVRRAQELLDLVQLGALGKRYPAQLSGGQRQRVALARALAVDPKLLLLDEPFGALDAKVRKELRRWLRDLHDRMGLTSVFVTHDQEEALELADRVVVMDRGLIEQVAGPQIIYDEPATAFVYDFVGDSNRIPVSVEEGRVMFGGAAVDVQVAPAPDGPALLYFRPQDGIVVDEGSPGTLPLQICQAVHLGGVTRIEGKIPGVEALIDLRSGGGEVQPAGRAAGLRIGRARLFTAPSAGS
jgi:sulfate transport system ATP-binding protein